MPHPLLTLTAHGEISVFHVETAEIQAVEGVTGPWAQLKIYSWPEAREKLDPTAAEYRGLDLKLHGPYTIHIIEPRYRIRPPLSFTLVLETSGRT